MQRVINLTIVGFALAITLIIYSRAQREVERAEQNIYALEESITHYQTQLGKQAASIQALRLECDELRHLRQQDAQKIGSLGIKLRRVESLAKSSTTTSVELKSPLRDTVILSDSVKEFFWRDNWVEILGRIRKDSVECRLTSHDTLFQVVHRIPRRFLFIKWGTKALRQEIVSTNPHSRIVYAEYIKIEK